MIRRIWTLLVSVLAVAVTGHAAPPQGVSIPVLAHYMDWAVANDPDSWASAGILPADYPNGYDSKDPAVIAHYNTLMDANGITPMVSWWARDTYAGDAFLDAYLAIPGPKFGILYEAVGPGRLQAGAKGDVDFSDQANADLFISDMAHLQTKYFSKYPDRFFTIDGRPVVFIWISHAFTGPFDKVVQQARKNSTFYLVGSDFTSPWAMSAGHESVIRGMDAITAYGFFDVRRYNSQLNLQFLADYRSAVIRWIDWLGANSPQTRLLLPMGFSYDERKIPGRKNIYFMSSFEMARQFAELVRWLIESQCARGRILSVAYITSYTEWYEASAIAPSDKYGDRYQQIINDVFNVPRGPLAAECVQ